ncbi:unnamed protein product [Calicophoron daubneyi]|uniref:DNA-directed RNA polymerase III subunit RPC9 n=1 Tax=Calicophoron daubneyi TaxID=300641 RepID=A0AAV2T737_CALDB
MEVERKSIRYLTNFEVLQLINSRLESKKKIRSQQTLLYTSSKYLKTKTSCSTQTPEAIHKFCQAVKRFRLTRLEILMLINHCPSTQVELSVLIGDLDSRLTAKDTDRLLGLVAKHFPEGVTASQAINSAGVSEETDITSQ